MASPQSEANTIVLPPVEIPPQTTNERRNGIDDRFSCQQSSSGEQLVALPELRLPVEVVVVS
jgi:hypothetical protein